MTYLTSNYYSISVPNEELFDAWNHPFSIHRSSSKAQPRDCSLEVDLVYKNSLLFKPRRNEHKDLGRNCDTNCNEIANFLLLYLETTIIKEYS